MRNIKKISFILLILSLIVNTTYVNVYADEINNTEFEEEIMTLGFSPVIVKCNKMIKANKDIYKNLGLVIYGEPSDLKDNNFKKIENGSFEDDEGIKGEYEYLGCNEYGLSVKNPYFPIENFVPFLAKKQYGSKYDFDHLVCMGMDRDNIMNLMKNSKIYSGKKLEEFLPNKFTQEYAVVITGGKKYIFSLECWGFTTDVEGDLCIETRTISFISEISEV